jgi:hypothetical protein
MSISSASLSGFLSTPTSPVSVAQPSKSSNLNSNSAQSSVVQQFLAYANMTPAQRMQASMLSQLGLTEQQFQAMSPADQQKVEEKIQDMIKKQMDSTNDKRSGMITDISV